MAALDGISTLNDYFARFGDKMGKKVAEGLRPLHLPGVDPNHDFSDLSRQPFAAQAEACTAIGKMFDEANSGFLVSECGTGKTMMAIVSIHKHARGKNYRACVLCPDHLIGKWVEEIEMTLPGVKVRKFDRWGEILELAEQGTEYTRKVNGQDDGVVTTRRKRWAKLNAPEWYVVGRDQAKYAPKWEGIENTTRVSIGRTPKLDEQGQEVRRADGEIAYRNILADGVRCPKCGALQHAKGGSLADVGSLSKTKSNCGELVFREVVDPNANTERSLAPSVYHDTDDRGLDRPSSFRWKGEAKLGSLVKMDGRLWRAEECGEPLWNWTPHPYRWAPATIIHKKMRRFLDYCVIDEIHEEKSDESIRSMAAGKLMASSRHTLCLTGTLIGGYARDLFPLLFRMNPRSLKAEGFRWGGTLEFSRAYGVVNQVFTSTRDMDDLKPSANELIVKKPKEPKVAKARDIERPGIMPSLFGRHMIGSSLFVSLKDMAEGLPALHEYIGGELRPQDADEDAAEYEEYRSMWVDTACVMSQEAHDEYDRVQDELVRANRELLAQGKMKLGAALMHTLMDYPDRPFGWAPEWEDTHSVGYYDIPKLRCASNWEGVVTPKDTDEGEITEKERKLMAICLTNVRAGNQCWVYLKMVGTRDITTRLRRLLESVGLTVGVLKANDCKPRDRKEWIDRNGPRVDVMLSNASLVSTGLDLFSKGGGHNFSTLVFYQTGYSVFELRQASRRAWRISQPKTCRVYYLYYRETMQARAMDLISRKLAASMAIEGDLSAEGLAALAGDDNSQMSLARSLSRQIDERDIQRNWGKVSMTPRKAKPCTDFGDAFDDAWTEEDEK